MAEDGIKLHRGLREVYIDRTKSSFIDGKAGKLYYRGYNIDDLAQNCSFEEVIYLVMMGNLPTVDELSDFKKELVANMELSDAALEIIRITKSAHPMDVLRTTISALSAFDPDVDDNSREAVIRKGLRLTAIAPTIIAAHHRLSSGQKPIDPNPNLTHAGNFLYMLFDEEPTPEDTTSWK